MENKTLKYNPIYVGNFEKYLKNNWYKVKKDYLKNKNYIRIYSLREILEESNNLVIHNTDNFNFTWYSILQFLNEITLDNMIRPDYFYNNLYENCNLVSTKIIWSIISRTYTSKYLKALYNCIINCKVNYVVFLSSVINNIIERNNKLLLEIYEIIKYDNELYNLFNKEWNNNQYYLNLAFKRTILNFI